MDAKKYHAAVTLATQSASKAGVTLPELIGVLEMVKLDLERSAYEAHKDKKIMQVRHPLPPGLNNG